MNKHENNEICIDFTPKQNTYFSANTNKHITNTSKPFQCVNCAYLTSRNCNHQVKLNSSFSI